MFLIGSSIVRNSYTSCYLLNNSIICPRLQFWGKQKNKRKKKFNTPPHTHTHTLLQYYHAETLRQILKKNTAAVIYQVLQYSSKAR